MKKTALVTVLVFAMLTMMVSSAFATPSNVITNEQQLNTQLANVGTPAEVISGLTYNDKYYLINNTGADLRFDGYTKESFKRDPVTGKMNPSTDTSFHSNNLVSPMGYISPSDLTLVMSHFTHTSGG